MGRKLTILWVKFNDLVMNLARYRDSVIVHTKRLCSGVAREASWWRWHLTWWGEEVGDIHSGRRPRQDRAPMGAGGAEILAPCTGLSLGVRGRSAGLTSELSGGVG